MHIVQVGDHDAEISAARKSAAELFAVSKVSWSVAEYRALADRYADAASALQIAVVTKNFKGVRSAYLSLCEILEQSVFLNKGLFNALFAAGADQK